MSKELIEQLAKEHGHKYRQFGDVAHTYAFTMTQLEAFAKAYQAAAPIDNVAEALEKAAQVCLNEAQEWRSVGDEMAVGTASLCASKIRALISKEGT
jgi:hypothetical protein